MLPGWIAILVFLAYVAAFRGAARFGDAPARVAARPWLRASIYALSSCITFGFWSSFGAVATASRYGLRFMPLFLGPIIIFAVFHPVISRMIRIARAQRITSIADFIAMRYGRSVPVAAIVALISLFAAVPFIAVQLQAIAQALQVLAGGQLFGLAVLDAGGHGAVALVAVTIGALAIVVGTRRVDATEHHGGLVTALAAESLVRVVSMLGLGVFVCWGLYKGIGDLTGQVAHSPRLEAILDSTPSPAHWLPLTLVTMAATLVVPRQFHVCVVECRNESDVRVAAWLVPACLVATGIFVLPIAGAGLVAFPGAPLGQAFIPLELPLRSGHPMFALLALVSGLSASIGTVVMATVAMSVMACNDLAVPLLLLSGMKSGRRQIVAPPILAIRRLATASIVALSVLVAFRLGKTAISTIDLSSVVVLVQIAPAVIGAMIWSGATARGAIGGMLSGVAVSTYTLVLPIFVAHGSPLLTLGPLGLDALRPTDLFGVDLAPVQQGVVWSLTINIAVYVVLSLSRRPTTGERLQANVFVRARSMSQATSFRLKSASIPVGELSAAVAPFVGTQTAERLFAEHYAARGLPLERAQAADPQLLQYAERLIASAIGAASARMVISLLLERREMSRDAARRIIDDAAFEIQNSRDLLQHAIDIARDGMAIFDAELRLVAWNQAYRDMFRFPKGGLRVGVPLEVLIRSNAERGVYGEQADSEDFVTARLETLAQPTQGLRMLAAPAGRVLEMRSVRLHNGGLFFTYSDATAQAQSEEELEAENVTLEARVRERTEALERLNVELVRAKAEAENANITKSRFLAAASHDVLQPLSAARLYATSLRERLESVANAEAALALSANVDQSLGAVEDVMTALLEISQLDAGATKTRLSSFALQPLLHELRIDFEPLAIDKGLRLTFVATSLNARSDRRLLRRLLQNLISNALKYTTSGRVLVGVRRSKGAARIEVLDTGVGIPESKLQVIFREFERLPSGAQAERGAGLGLSIVERLSRVLNHAVVVRSTLGRGSRFAVTVPLADTAAHLTRQVQAPPIRQGLLDGLVIAAVDNERPILAAIEGLLHAWGCVVACGADLVGLEAELAKRSLKPDAIVADYHIGEVDGLAVIAALRARHGAIPAVLVTADHSSQLRELARLAGVRVLNKPLRPATLRALLAQWRLVKTAAE